MKQALPQKETTHAPCHSPEPPATLRPAPDRTGTCDQQGRYHGNGQRRMALQPSRRLSHAIGSAPHGTQGAHLQTDTRPQFRALHQQLLFSQRQLKATFSIHGLHRQGMLDALSLYATHPHRKPIPADWRRINAFPHLVAAHDAVRSGRQYQYPETRR